MTDGKRTWSGQTEICVEFSTGIMLTNSDVVAMPPDAETDPFVRPVTREVHSYREQVTARNPQTGSLITLFQVKFGSSDDQPMRIAVMHSDDLGITWENR